MTNIEYIRQLPGCEDFTFEGIICTKDVGLDEDCCGDCEECEKEKATIGGKPAPYLYACPVKPGQKVYFARFNGTTEDEVICVSFYEEDGEIKWEACNDLHEYFGNGTGHQRKWNEEVFNTREEAEKAVKERTKDGDQ